MAKDDESPNIDFTELEDYLSSNDGIDLTHYIPFLQLLESGCLHFRDFDKYSFDELLKIRRTYSLGIYLKNKMETKLNNDL